MLSVPITTPTWTSLGGGGRDIGGLDGLGPQKVTSRSHISSSKTPCRYGGPVHQLGARQQHGQHRCKVPSEENISGCSSACPVLCTVAVSLKDTEHSCAWLGVCGRGWGHSACAGIVSMCQGVQGACVYSLNYRNFLDHGKCAGKDSLCVFPVSTPVMNWQGEDKTALSNSAFLRCRETLLLALNTV